MITKQKRIENALVSGMISYMVLGILFSNMLIDVIMPRLLSMAVFFCVTFLIGVVISEIAARMSTRCVASHRDADQNKVENPTKNKLNIWLAPLIVYQLIALPIVFKNLHIFLSKELESAILPIIANGVIISILYFGYIQSKVNEAVAGIDLGSYEKLRMYGVDAFGVAAFRYNDMLFSINRLRSNRSVFAELTEGHGGIAVVFWFPQPLGAVFNINNFLCGAPLLKVRRGLLTYQLKANWNYSTLSMSNCDYAQFRWGLADPSIENLLLSEQTCNNLAVFAEAISTYGGRFRIEERAITALFPAKTELNRIILEKGYDLWRHFADKPLPRIKYNPFCSKWNIFVILLMALTVIIIAIAIFNDLRG